MTKKSLLPHIISIVFFTLIAIAMIVVYFVFLQKSTQVVEESLKVTPLSPTLTHNPLDLQCQ
jgi:flagellar basal body-associated protein FliL